jgi:DNA primase
LSDQIEIHGNPNLNQGLYLMTASFSQDIIARVKDETDIGEVVRQHVTLKPAGAVFKGLCPFHKEKTPSFIVTPSRGRYHCFGCGAGGDAISFIMEIEGLSFPEAVEILARPLNIDLSSYLADEETEGERRSFHRANEAATQLWVEALADPNLGGPALEYLTGRGFVEKFLRDFHVGWAPGIPGWLEKNLARSGVDSELAHRADLLRTGDRPGSYAYFRNRIIFPIRSISRQVVGFGGRIVDQGEPKYLNSADSTYFSKGKLLYGFDSARMPMAREKTAILVEGYLDVIALVQAGINNVAATCGTAFTPDQAKLIRRGAQNVFLVFDGDKAGLKAAVRSADVALKHGLEPKIVSLPAGEDPASLVIGTGPDAMHQALSEARGYIPFLKGLADEKGGDRELNERALRQALGTIAGIPDSLRRAYVLQEAADVFEMPLSLLRESLEKMEILEKPRTKASSSRPTSGQESISSGEPPLGDEPGFLDEESGFETGQSPSGPHSTAGNPTRGPRVRRPLGLVKVDQIEGQMFAHILADESGKAALRFLQDRGDLPFLLDGASLLADELSTWAATATGPDTPPPLEFVQERWNTAGDREYRAFITQLLDRGTPPPDTDFAQVITDCLGRLRQGHRSRRG